MISLQVNQEFTPDRIVLFGSHARSAVGRGQDCGFAVVIVACLFIGFRQNTLPDTNSASVCQVICSAPRKDLKNLSM